MVENPHKRHVISRNNFREILNCAFYGTKGEKGYTGFEYEMDRNGGGASIYRSGSKQHEKELVRLQLHDGGGLTISRGPDIDNEAYENLKTEIERDVKSGIKKYESSREKERRKNRD